MIRYIHGDVFFFKTWGEAWSERVLDDKIFINGNGPSHIQTLHFLSSHKRIPLLSGHFFWSRGISLTGGLTRDCTFKCVKIPVSVQPGYNLPINYLRNVERNGMLYVKLSRGIVRFLSRSVSDYSSQSQVLPRCLTPPGMWRLRVCGLLLTSSGLYFLLLLLCRN